MALVSNDELLQLDSLCEEILDERGVRFAGIVSKHGSIQAGGFKPGINTYEMDHKRKIMDIQIRLNLSMEQESSESIMQYTLSKQKDITVITIPYEKEFLVISTADYVNPIEIIDKVKRIYRPENLKKNIIDSRKFV